MNRLQRYIETKTSHILNALETDRAGGSKIVFLSGKLGKTTILNEIKSKANKKIYSMESSMKHMHIFESTRVFYYRLNKEIDANNERLIEAIIVEVGDSDDDIKWLIDVANKMEVNLLIASSKSIESFKSIIGKKRVKCFSLKYVNEKNRVKEKTTLPVENDKNLSELFLRMMNSEGGMAFSYFLLNKMGEWILEAKKQYEKNHMKCSENNHKH